MRHVTLNFCQLEKTRLWCDAVAGFFVSVSRKSQVDALYRIISYHLENQPTLPCSFWAIPLLWVHKITVLTRSLLNRDGLKSSEIVGPGFHLFENSLSAISTQINNNARNGGPLFVNRFSLGDARFP